MVPLTNSIDPADFVAYLKPLLERRDVSALSDALRLRWQPKQLIEFLNCGDHDAEKVAALALGLVGGTTRCIAELCERLRDPDPTTHQMAEHALWTIWFRAGTPKANCLLGKGMNRLRDGMLDEAIAHFTDAIDVDPSFAEAYNQRAIARFLQEQYAASAADCRRTIDRMPCHFGAWAALGHCQAHRGEFAAAIDSYERALAIHPFLEGIRHTLDELRNRINEVD